MYGQYYQQPQTGFQNPYLERLNSMQAAVQPQQQFQPRVEITKVSGQNGANAYQLPPNSSILLLDDSQPIVWLKTTDGAGYPTCTPYSIAPYQQPKNDIEQRLERLEALIYGSKSDFAAADQPASTAGGKPSANDTAV